MKKLTKSLIPAIAFSLGISANVFADYEVNLGIVESQLGSGDADDRLGTTVGISGNFAILGAEFDDDNGSNSGSAFIYEKSNGVWVQHSQLTPNDAAAEDDFGCSVAIDGNYAIVGSKFDDDDGSKSGSAYIFFYDGTSWNQQAKITANDANAGDEFGGAVAISGDYVIVGAYKNDDAGSASGSAYIFVRSGTSWTEQQELQASNAGGGDNFGISVDIEGEYVIVGAWHEDTKSSDAGAAYIFNRSGTTWTEQNKITASDGANADNFGYRVGISGDYAVAGARGDDTDGASSGSAYIFARSGSSWSQEQKLTASDASGSSSFGAFVAINNEKVLIGANGVDANGNNSGAAYTFVRESGTWTEKAIITGTGITADSHFGIGVALDDNNLIIGSRKDSNNEGTAYIYTLELVNSLKADDNLGRSVDIDGDYAIVGANSSDAIASDAGSAYIFVRNGGNWDVQAHLVANDLAADDNFGTSVAISGDYAIVGSSKDDDDGSSSGSAYIFVRSGTTWSQQAKLTANDAFAGDDFGEAVAIDGDYAIVGASDNGAGSAYVFLRSGTSWSQQAKLTASNAGSGDNFGVSVSIDGEYAIVGAFQEDTGGPDRGSAYIYKRSGTSWSEEDKINPNDASNNDNFGIAVGISGDYVVVGARLDDDAGSSSGSAYIFTRSGTSWSQEAKLTASDADAGDSFGTSASIEGDNVIIGASSNDDGGSNSGSSYVFQRSGVNWTENSKFTASDAAADDKFGISVGISGDYIISGAFQSDTFVTDGGAAYIQTFVPFNNGNVTQNIAGNGTVSFNDGNGEDTGIDIDFTGVSNSANIQCESFSETPATTDGISGTVQPVRWEITDGGLAFTNAEIRIDMTTLPVTIDFPSAAVIYHRSTPGSGNFTALATTVEGNELVGNTGSFSEFAIGGGDVPLSVELQNFSARQIENTIQLSWATASETENEGFNVYRKTGESNFVQIASFRTHEELLGQGNTTGQTNYIFVDDSELKVNETYTYYISDVEFNGLETKHSEMEQSVVFGVDSEVVRKFELAQNFPNPFNPSTTLKFQVAKDSRVSLKIYNLLGQEVKTLVNELKVAGSYDVKWDGLNNQNISVSTGVYFAKIQAGTFSKIVKMSLIK